MREDSPNHLRVVLAAPSLSDPAVGVAVNARNGTLPIKQESFFPALSQSNDTTIFYVKDEDWCSCLEQHFYLALSDLLESIEDYSEEEGRFI